MTHTPGSVRKGWYDLDHHHDRNNEQNPYADGDVPYYEYASPRRPLQPVIPPALPTSALPEPPQRKRLNRGLLLILAGVSVMLAVMVIFLSLFSSALFRPSAPAKTPVTTVPTHA